MLLFDFHIVFHFIGHISGNPWHEHIVLRGFGHTIIDDPESADIDQPLQALQVEN
jgi:hypothetical protein